MASPLFPKFTQAMKQQVHREFKRSDLGRMVDEVNRAKRSRTTSSRMADAMERYSRDPSRTLRQMAKGDLGRFIREVEQYANGSGIAKRFFGELIGSMGPVGGLVKALIGPKRGRRSGLKRDIDAAAAFLEAFGEDFGVKVSRSGKSSKRRKATPTAADMDRKLAEARKVLEAAGATVVMPGEEAEAEKKRLPYWIPEKTKGGKRRKVADIVVDGKKRRFPVSHPIVSKAVVFSPESSNVHSFNYDIEQEWLHVRFLNPEGGRGPLYRYFNIRPSLFLKMLSAPSKGTFVWDHLRIRGTVSGHQVDYALAGVTGGYVPRKATLRPGGEWYIGRSVTTKGGKRYSSRKPDRLVRALQPVNRGTPNRG